MQNYTSAVSFSSCVHVPAHAVFSLSSTYQHAQLQAFLNTGNVSKPRTMWSFIVLSSFSWWILTMFADTQNAYQRMVFPKITPQQIGLGSWNTELLEVGERLLPPSVASSWMIHCIWESQVINSAYTGMSYCRLQIRLANTILTNIMQALEVTAGL